MKVSGDGLKRACAGEVAWFEIESRTTASADVSVKITSPSGARVTVQIAKSSRGFRVEYTPVEVGPHRISTKYADVPLSGSPFTCDVYDPSKVSAGVTSRFKLSHGNDVLNTS